MRVHSLTGITFKYLSLCVDGSAFIFSQSLPLHCLMEGYGVCWSTSSYSWAYSRTLQGVWRHPLPRLPCAICLIHLADKSLLRLQEEPILMSESIKLLFKQFFPDEVALKKLSSRGASFKHDFKAEIMLQ